MVTQSPWLLVGLGNPGPTYAGNRHNVGAMVAAELATRHDVPGSRSPAFKTHKARALVDEVRLGAGPHGDPERAVRAVVAVPSTYMNESGGPVKALMSYFSIPLDHLVVLHDELDIPFGDVRLKRGGGEGGHNGLRSISASVGSKDYLRVRVGIGRPPGRMDPADYVLRDFATPQRAELPFLLDTAADAAESLVHVGLLASQQRFHGES